MNRIMFVCHGNICRSPMAEMILKSVVREKGLESDYLIESSATSTEEIGNSIYPPARAELSINGIDIEPHRAVRFKPGDYDRFDYIICMDRWNKRNLMNIIGNDPENKVKLFNRLGKFFF